MSTTKRTNTAPAAPKPPISLAPAITISDSASLLGTKLITIGGDSVVHPRAKLISSLAPVTIGKACILSERSAVGLQSPSNDQPEGVVIEDCVVVEVGAIVEAKRVGEGTIVEINARVGKGAVIGKVCVICTRLLHHTDELLVQSTVR
jgi:dynactin-6